MPIGDPPTRPAEGAPEEDYEKYRADFDAYVAAKIGDFATTELTLRK